MSRLTRAREMAGLSLAQANRLLGWKGTDTLADMEAGDVPGDATAARLADLYGVSLAWLRGEDIELPESTRQVLREVEHTGDRVRLTELLEATQGRKP